MESLLRPVSLQSAVEEGRQLGMAYQYDIFISYRRSQTVGQWVQNHLAPRLELRLNEVAPVPVRVFCDFKMDEGVNWPAELKRQVQNSSLLLTVWSADYFRSSWCMAEWQSFRSRETLLGLFSAQNPQGLVYPVRYADGASFHADAQVTQCRKDFSRLNYPDDVFRTTAKYLEFDDLVREMAAELVARLGAVPVWRNDFPIVEPAPLPPPVLTRPVI
jgi:TIR domain